MALTNSTTNVVDSVNNFDSQQANKDASSFLAMMDKIVPPIDEKVVRGLMSMTPQEQQLYIKNYPDLKDKLYKFFEDMIDLKTEAEKLVKKYESVLGSPARSQQLTDRNKQEQLKDLNKSRY